MEQHRRRRATPPAATILTTNLLTHLLLEQASPKVSPSTKPRVHLLNTHPRSSRSSTLSSTSFPWTSLPPILHLTGNLS
uniref:Uncharacterized protein n=1 Tax=Triticum urartu TaxID=4572 RepID=A0A8R7QT70_TRIUA